MHYHRDPYGRIASTEITPQAVYESRRDWLKLMAAGALAATWAGREAHAALPGIKSAVPGALTMEKPTARQDATSYNNFYEFGTDK
ncbi:MAG TPA: protein-methionine-sulfoxide reductase catalytic subunit MsrP, partial [Roseateles sp.]|nr:protein-methionine-sulfoxide reductase catalytic subunit MsrP [Roseateles sp.]